MKIAVHPLSENPTAAWKELMKTQKVLKLNAEALLTPTSNDKLRFVCMSDTHSRTQSIKFDIPDGDVFVHAGDFTERGRFKEVVDFNNWLGKLPHQHKIVIAGNNDLSFDSTYGVKHSVRTGSIKDKLENCTYLENSAVFINGIKIYGSPWTPKYYGGAFKLPRGEKCLSNWDMIPSDTDILVTHGPPIGHGDLCRDELRAGCVELLNTVQNRVNPKFHVFGHIHEGYGISSDGNTIFINASTCDAKYAPINLPIVFDVTLPLEAKKPSVSTVTSK